MKWSDEEVEEMRARLMRIMKRAHEPLTIKGLHGRVFDRWGPRTTHILLTGMMGEGLVCRLAGAGPARADLYRLTETGRLELEARR